MGLASLGKVLDWDIRKNEETERYNNYGEKFVNKGTITIYLWIIASTSLN